MASPQALKQKRAVEPEIMPAAQPAGHQTEAAATDLQAQTSERCMHLSPIQQQKETPKNLRSLMQSPAVKPYIYMGYNGTWRQVGLGRGVFEETGSDSSCA